MQGSNYNEGKFWKNNLRMQFSAMGHCNRLESGATAIGIPDVNLQVLHGPQWWIELKHYRKDKPWEVRPAQRGWIKQRVGVGGNVCVLGRDDSLMVPSFLLIKGIHVPNLVHKELQSWYDNAYQVWDTSINWIELEQFLHEQAESR